MRYVHHFLLALRYEPQLYVWQLDQTLRLSWRELFKLKIEDEGELENLLDAEGYANSIDED